MVGIQGLLHVRDEHGVHGLFVAEPGDVVEGAAVGGLETPGSPGSRRLKRETDFKMRRNLRKTGSLRHSSSGLTWRCQQFVHDAGIDQGGVGIHGDQLAGVEDLGGAAHLHQGGNAELPGQDGHVVGGAAHFGDDGGDAVHDQDQAGGRLAAHHHGPRGNAG